MNARLLPAAGICALVGLVGCGAGLLFDPAGLAQAWLVAVETLLGLPLGAAALLLLHALTAGRWGEGIRHELRALVALLPLALILFVPLLAVIPALLPYISAPPDTLPGAVVRKLGWLTPFWIIVRAIVCAALWLGIGLVAARSERPPSRLAATLGLIAYGLSLTIFTTDWGQALEPEFVSTIYAMLVAGEQLLGALAAATAWHLLARDQRNEAGGAANSTLSGDLAKLLLSAILFWAYLAYMQYLIIWIGGLPGEIAWYLRRDAGFWPLLFWLTLLGFAAIPFLAILLRPVRKSAGGVAGLALLILAGYVGESVWRLAPAFAPPPATLPFALLAVCGIGGLVLLVRVRRVLPLGVQHG